MNKLKSGDVVVVTDITKSLINDLPEDDQLAINSIIGKALKILDITESNFAEIEFIYDDNIHTIWLELEYLKLISELA